MERQVLGSRSHCAVTRLYVSSVGSHAMRERRWKLGVDAVKVLCQRSQGSTRFGFSAVSCVHILIVHRGS